MLIWIIYVVFVSTLLGIAALAAEQRAHLRRKTSRWYWIAAIVASLLIPTVIASVSVQLPDIFSPSVSQKMIALREVTSSHLSPMVWISGNLSHGSDYRNFDPLVKQLWLALSALLLCGLLASGAHLLWRKRQWTKGTLLKTSVLITDDVGPAVVGLVDPQIVIPRWIIDASPEQQRAVIAHEQSHLDAGDPRLLTVALCLLVFMPWNLPLWWQLRRLRCAIEVDCDARVLRAGQSLTSYGDTLIAVGQRQSGYIGSVAGMSESTSFLEKRIKIMVTKPAKWWRISAIAFGLASCCLVAVAAQVSPPNANNSAAIERKEIVLPESSLDKYIGQFKFSDTAVMAISRKDKQLLSQLTGQPAVEIYPESVSEFFLKVVDAQLSFVFDEQGQITSLVLHQNGHNITAPRIDEATAAQITYKQTSKVQNQTQTPGSETALRGLIAGIASNSPDYTTMVPELAQATRDQLKRLNAGAKALGEIKSIKFRGVGNQGWDIYDVSHEYGNSEWRIVLSESGLIAGALVNSGP